MMGIEELKLKMERLKIDRNYFKCFLREQHTPATLQLPKSIKTSVRYGDIVKIERSIIKSVIKKKGKQMYLLSKKIKLMKKTDNSKNDNNKNSDNKNTNDQYKVKKSIKLTQKFDYPSTADKEEWLNKLIINLTNVDVPNDYLRLLSYGDNMNFPIFSKSIEVVAEIESAIRRISGKSKEKEQLRIHLSKDLQKFKGKGAYNQYIVDKKAINITNKMNRLTKYFKHKQLSIIKADKSHALIIITNSDLQSKKKEIVSTDEYEQLHNNPTEDIKKGLMKLMKKYKKEFANQEYKKIIDFNKIHFYRQKDGIAMGSVIGPKIADICMTSLDQKIFQFQGISFYARYVDDILILYDSNITTAQNIETYANSLNNDIRFTYEEEKNNEINYLDVTITRNEKTLLFRIKRNVFIMELRKILNRTTLQKHIELETENLFKKYLLNDYPQQVILGEQKNRLSKSIHVVNRGIVGHSQDPLKTAGVVYKLICTCPESKIYVGETGRQLEQRVKEHEAAIRLKRSESPCYANTINLNTGVSIDACWDMLVEYQSTDNVKRKNH
ncbi:uncharacterized protein [Centruroides vittatus]|uniref:uncharacterized protein n=1 Tax=Centruroides vittatus TaxID=120091 RepID=UPI00350F5D05